MLMEPETTDVMNDSRTLRPLLLGAKSVCGREQRPRLVVGDSIGLDLMGMTEKDDGKLPGELEGTKDKHINSQKIL